MSARLDEIQALQEKAREDLLMAARIWRDYQREKNRKFAAQWLKKLGAWIDEEAALRKAWREQYAFERAEEGQQAAAIAAFESDGGRLDIAKEAFDAWRCDALLRLAGQRRQGVRP